ncbi:MAG: hypothetical protein RI967_2284 [Planctomycetota bacterium]
MHSIIVGGGIAGLALAASLAKTDAGATRTLLERRELASPAGLGFLLLENGLDALARIVPDFDPARLGREVSAVALLDRDGRPLAEHPTAPARCVERRDLLDLLRAAAAGTTIRDMRAACDLAFDGASDRAPCGGIANDPSERRVRAVRLEDGTEVAGDLFFACDGARSRLRTVLEPASRLSDASVLEIVSSIESAPLAARLGTTFHKYHDPEGGLAAGLLATGPSRVVWFMQVDGRRWRPRDRSADALHAFTAERLAGWAPEVAAAIAATDFARSHLWATRDLPPLPRLAWGNIALVGDAAHACLPFTSQGANGALVDAALLGALLADARDHSAATAALARYSEIRRPHHAHMYREGRRLHDLFLAPLGGRGPVVPIAA